MKVDGLLNTERAENYDGGRGRGGCMIRPTEREEGCWTRATRESEYLAKKTKVEKMQIIRKG